MPLDAGFFYPKDIEDIYDRLREAQEEIEDLKNSKQSNIIVPSDDNMLSLDGSKLFSELHLTYSPEDRYIYLTGKNNQLIGKVPTVDFVKDGMLESATYNKDNRSLTLIFNEAAGKKEITIELDSLVDVYTAGYGLILENGEFKINSEVIAVKEDLDKLSSTLNTTISSLKKEFEDYSSKIDQEIANLKTSVSDVEKNYKAADEQIIDKINNLTKLN